MSTVQIESRLEQVLQPSEFFAEYTRCICFEIHSAKCKNNEQKRWLSLCESLIRHVALDLELRLKLPAWTLHPFPQRFALRTGSDAVDIVPGCSVYLFGIVDDDGVARTSTLDEEQLLAEQHNAARNFRDLALQRALDSQLSSDGQEDGTR